MTSQRSAPEMFFAGEGNQVEIFAGDHHIVNIPIIAESKACSNTLPDCGGRLGNRLLPGMNYCGLPGFLHWDSIKGPWYFSQLSPGESCAHRIVLSVLFFHLYQGAPEANASKQISASRSKAANLVFTKYPFRNSDGFVRGFYRRLLPMPPDL